MVTVETGGQSPAAPDFARGDGSVCELWYDRNSSETDASDLRLRVCERRFAG